MTDKITIDTGYCLQIGDGPRLELTAAPTAVGDGLDLTISIGAAHIVLSIDKTDHRMAARNLNSFLNTVLSEGARIDQGRDEEQFQARHRAGGADLPVGSLDFPPGGEDEQIPHAEMPPGYRDRHPSQVGALSTVAHADEPTPE